LTSYLVGVEGSGLGAAQGAESSHVGLSDAEVLGAASVRVDLEGQV